LHRFPFGIVYEIESENISVIAIMHLRAPAGLLEATPSTESQARRWNSRV
jgi:hypothetical protein